MYAVMWSEHCSYKSSRIHLRRLPTEAPARARRARARAPAWSTSATASPPPSASRATTTRRPSSPTRARPPASAASSATSSPSAPGRSPSWIRCASAHSTTPAAGGSPRASCPAFPATATRSACPPSAARSCSTRPIRTTRSSTCSASACCPPSGSCWPGRRASATSRCCSARPPAATASAGPACWPRPASARTGDDDKRPSVQVGDPFEEKRLIEACLEILDAGLVVGIQDLGAAGITGATSETSSKGGVGMDVYLSEVHVREEGMEPFEVMTSESQERMLAIVEPDKLDELLAICRRWEIRASVIGTVTGSGRLPRPRPPRRRGARRHPGRRRSTTTRRSTTVRSPRRPTGSRPPRPPPSTCRRPVDAGADLLDLLARPVVGVPPVRPPAVPQHGRGPGRRRHRAAAQAPDHRRRHRPRPGAHHRRQPPLVRARPAAGHRAGRGRGA